MSGKVWLVGAGPGDAGLFTLKGKKVLEEADVVVYDALVGQAVLSMIPEGAEVIFAGKRSGNHFLKQEDTNRVLLEEAQKGKKVVRLKGGDPFVFGRGGEELELLTENKIPFEIVPGVTSAFAVPAYNGIPVTHRDFCSSVHIITGHKRSGEEYNINFNALAQTNGTLVFLMGVAALPDICKGLLEGGMSEDTPAAVLEQGTGAGQGRISGNLKTLPEICAQREVKTPAIIVVGDVCTLAEDFAWYEKLPLFGLKIALTRPKELISQFASMLREEGAEVLEIPAIAIKPRQDNAELSEAVEALAKGEYDWIVFTSPSGVRIFMDELFKIKDIRLLSAVKIASIGKGSEKELNKYGLKADFIPSVYDGETLGKELCAKLGKGERILIPRAAIGNKELVEELDKAEDVKIKDIATYDTVYETSKVIDEKAEFENGNVDLAVFTSASTVKGFAESLKGLDFSKVNAVCIGKQTEAKARKAGMKTWKAKKATLDALLECVKEAAAEIKAKR